MRSFTPLLVPVALWTLILQDIILQTSGFKIYSRNVPSSSQFDRRGSVNGSTTSGNGSVPLNDKQNTQYLANVTVGGTPLSVIVDTGSSDLWVTGNIAQTQDINVTASLQYAVGLANGNVNAASVQFAGHNVSHQAYLLVKDTSSFSANLPAQGISGLMGLGPGQGSVIAEKVGNSSGDALLDRIFQQDKSTPNYISFLLQRNNDPTPQFSGQLTIGETVEGFDNITSQQQLPVQSLANDTRVNQHWTIQLDEDGIIGPDGKPIKKSSIVPDNNGRLYAIIDSGFSLPQVPRSVSDAIYGRVKGANWSVESNVWTIPCGQELNISFMIGGVKFPVHPLDASMSEFGLKDANGNAVCTGSFQPITSAFSLAGQFDLILGMGFLRNAYTLLNFGNFVDGGSSTAAPYVQLLPTTDSSQAHQDFVTARLSGVDTSGASQYQLLPAGKGQSSPVPLDERVQHTEQKFIRYMPLIIVGCIAFAALCAGYGIFRWIRIRRARRALQSRNMISKPMESGQRKYAELGDGYGHSEASINLQNLGTRTVDSYNTNPYNRGRW